MLNSRPLLLLSDNVNFLTSAHFLVDRASYLIPEPDYSKGNIPAGRQWQLVSQRLQHFGHGGEMSTSHIFSPDKNGTTRPDRFSLVTSFSFNETTLNQVIDPWPKLQQFT